MIVRGHLEDGQAGDADLSRRAVVQRFGIGGIAAVLAARAVGEVTARDATPVAPAGPVPPVVQAWIDARNAQDAAAHAALYTADGVLEDVPNQSAIRGDQIRSFVEFTLRGLVDIKVELRHAFGTADWALAEYLFTATNRGLIPVPATVGKSFRARTVTVFELHGDQIRRSADYYDLNTIFRQLGLLPGPSVPPTGGTAAAGTPTS